MYCLGPRERSQRPRGEASIHRREFLRLAAAAAALPAPPRAAWGQAYPSQPVRIVVGFASGGPNDIFARLIAQWLADRLGQPFVVENRPGASTNIATDLVVRAPADGYTLLFIAQPVAINANLYKNLSFNFIRDIAPVASLVRQSLVMVVHPDVPAKTFTEFFAYAKANPGKLNMASVGIGSTPHIAGELFKMLTGIDMLHVPYRGSGPAVTDLLAGQVQVLFTGPPTLLEHIKTGKLRALATTSAKRLPELPDVPAVNEFLPGYEANTWYGIGAPKGTPTQIIEKLNQAINAAIVDPSLVERFAAVGGIMFGGTPAEFGKLIADETEKWGKVIRAANIKIE
jgi:tripartite-type tricarboxylate transporter receptor subunit TctC